MPARKLILATGEMYHIFNKSLHKVSIFTSRSEFNLFLLTAKYYLQKEPMVKFSVFRQQKDKYKIDLSKTKVRIIAYCLMPNHYHFILKQLDEGGIKNFIHQLATSYSHYFNIKHENEGPVFQGKFKAVRIESEEQLVHLSRYIHLNPSTSFLVEDPEDYDFSSYKIYLGKEYNDFVETSVVMSCFRTPVRYKEFVNDRKDYQRDLAKIKQLLIE